MARRAALLGRFVQDPLVVAGPVLLTAIRFASSTVAAFLAIEGLDTRGIDAFFEAYARVLPLLLVPFGALAVLTWPEPFRIDAWSGLTLVLLATSAVFWAGFLEPGLLLLKGPWGALGLGLSVSGALLAESLAFDRRIALRSASLRARGGLWALAAGFALAYLVSSVRLMDLRTLLDAPLPAGAEWLLAYGPSLLLVALALAHWITVAWPEARGPRGWLQVLGPPLAFAALGAALSQGLGGYVFSHLQTWGGSYLVFVPTVVSLTLVGLAFGGALSVVLVLRTRMSPPAWRLLTAGLFVALFSGILAFDGALVSLSGLALGVAYVARALAGSFVPSVARNDST